MGIETSFRELKYAIGLTNFHAKKVEYIVQEVYARMIMYNFCEMITLHVIINQTDKRHIYQVNFTGHTDMQILFSMLQQWSSTGCGSINSKEYPACQRKS